MEQFNGLIWFYYSFFVFQMVDYRAKVSVIYSAASLRCVLFAYKVKHPKKEMQIWKDYFPFLSWACVPRDGEEPFVLW